MLSEWCECFAQLSWVIRRWSDGSHPRIYRPCLEMLEARTLLTAGDLDMTFGTGGKQVTDLAGPATAVALQSDGKIVVVGSSFTGAPTFTDFAVVRYNPDGSLDSTFGTGGKVTTDFSAVAQSSASGTSDSATGVVIEADGKIIVVGTAQVLGPGNRAFVALARYTSNGGLDAAFGTGGQVVSSFGTGGFDRGDALALQADGKIVVSGGTGDLNARAPGLVRYTLNGALDPTFGSSGSILVGSATDNFADYFDLAVQADGKIVAVTSAPNNSSFDFVIRRHNSDGSLDATFGTAGQVITDFGGNDGPKALVLQANGKAVVAGSSGASSALARYNINGTLDATFGAGGKLLTTFGAGNDARDVTLLHDGKILTVGSVTLAQNSDFSVLRYNPNGSLDASFGTDGKVSTDFGNNESGQGVVLQADGKIVTVGATGTNGSPSTQKFVLARYLGDAPGGTANQRLISQVYLDLFQRPADPGGLAFWSGQLDQDVSRTQVVLRMENTSEYHALEVQSLYGLVLRRSADSAGLAHWTAVLDQGATQEQLEVVFLGSDEYFQRAGGTNGGFVTALYRDVLSRAADTAGAGFWGQKLATGTPRGQVAAAFPASRESDEDEVNNLYEETLRRPADGSGLNNFVQLLQNGIANEQVRATLIASDEYFSRL